MLIHQLVDETPNGYPSLAAWQSSDPTLMQYRRFLYLHCRILSEAQYDLGLLERELDELDDHHNTDTESIRLHSFADDRSSPPDSTGVHRPRAQILADMREKLVDYGITRIWKLCKADNADVAR